MAEVLSLAEIERRYPDHWILIGDPVLTGSFDVSSGVVLFASRDRDEMYREAAGLKSAGAVASHCTQKVPDDEVFVL